MNSKVNTPNLRAASLVAALSLNLIATASLAQSQAGSYANSQATTYSNSQAETQSNSQAGTQSNTQAQSRAQSQAQSYAGTQATHPASASGSTAGTSPAPTTTTTTTTPSNSNQATVVPKGSDLVALQGPTKVVQSSTGWKTNSTFLDLKDGQQSLPLTFTVTNGGANMAKLQGIRMKLNGHEILTEKAFVGKEQVSVNLSDILSSGQTQLITETYGPQGAGLSWVLTTYKIKVSDIKPVNCKIGETVKITGKNFPTDKTAFKLSVDQTAAAITKATNTGIDFTVPKVAGGKRTVTLYIAGVKCDPLYIKVAAAPEVTGINLVGAAPGGDVIIQGKGFSTTASENVVLLKNPDGSMMTTVSAKSATDTEVTITLPMDIACPSDILATVKTNGQESAKGVGFFCSQRVIDKNTIQPGQW